MRKHPQSMHKNCNYHNLTATASECMDGCIGNNGFQPPRLYECYQDTQPDGACPTVSYFTDRRENWDIDLPHEIKRPAYCTYNYWGPNGIRERKGEPWGTHVQQN